MEYGCKCVAPARPRDLSVRAAKRGSLLHRVAVSVVAIAASSVVVSCSSVDSTQPAGPSETPSQAGSTISIPGMPRVIEVPPASEPPADGEPPSPPPPPAGPISDPIIQDCTDAWSQGLTPIPSDSPLYRTDLDIDGNGIACE